jgi:hypothetical protein
MQGAIPHAQGARDERLFSTASTRVDLLIALALGVAAAVVTLLIANVDPRLFGPLGWDFWFEADLPRELDTLTSTAANNYRTKVHPIYPLLTGVPTWVLFRLTGSWTTAIELELAGVSLLAAAALYATVRLAGGTRPLAAACVALYCASGAFLFFHGVAGTYALGGATMIIALAVGTEPLRRHRAAHVIAGALALGVTVTNWIASLATAAACHRPREALRLALASFLVVALLAAVQSNLFSRTGAFMQLVSEQRFTVPLDATRLRNVAVGMLAHSIVAPHAELGVGSEGDEPERTTLTAQGARLPEDLAGRLALAAWGALLAIGAWGAVRPGVVGTFRWPLLVTLAAQVVIYLKYGRETFLYSAHAAPLLIVFAALGLATPVRRALPALIAITAALCAYHNVGELRHARALYDGYLANPPPEAPLNESSHVR